MSVELINCIERFITLIAFEIFDTKMTFEMTFIMHVTIISERAVLTLRKFVCVNTNMSF